MIPSIICYLCGSVFFGWLAYLLSDPYGHHVAEQPWYSIKQISFAALLWPFILPYIFLMWLYYSYINK